MEDSPKDIGSQLKKRREDLGYSIKDVSERICIRKVHLESIEENRFSDLPGKVYVTGFVDVYSRYLGLDGKEMLKSLPESITPQIIKVSDVPVPENFDKKFNAKADKQGWGVFFLVLAIVLGLGLAVTLLPDLLFEENDYEKAHPYVKQPDPQTPEVSVKQQTPEQQTPVKEALITSKTEAEQVEQVKMTAKQVNNEETNMAEEARNPLPDIAPAGSSLRMLALAKGSLIINVDARKSHEYQLHDGLDLTWKINEQVKVKLSDAGIARFWIDGKEFEMTQEDSFFYKQTQRNNSNDHILPRMREALQN